MRPPMSAVPEMNGTYRFIRGVVRPWLMATTEQDWSGAEHLPRSGGFVLAANHNDHVDPLTLGHFLMDNGFAPAYLAKEELFRVPVLGPLMRRTDQIPVYRKSARAVDAYRDAEQALREGKCVLIYPEGTLTKDPGRWPMVGKTGAARLALQADVPVIPVAQWGARAIFHPGRGELLRRKRISVMAGPAVDFSDLRGRGLDGQLLREGTRRIMLDITTMLEQIRGERAPEIRFDPRSDAQQGS